MRREFIVLASLVILGVRTVSHAGQTGGFTSELVYCPELGVGVLVVGNVRSLRATEIAYRTLDLYLGEKLRPAPKASERAAETRSEPPSFTMAPAEYGRFVGGYRLDANPSVLVAVARGGDGLTGGMVGARSKAADFRPLAAWAAARAPASTARASEANDAPARYVAAILSRQQGRAHRSRAAEAAREGRGRRPAARKSIVPRGRSLPAQGRQGIDS